MRTTDRAVFAEFVVGRALGITDDTRVEWDAVDLRYGDKTLEVKASAYIQSWHQKQDSLSKISLDLKERFSWDAATNTYRFEPNRAADCYVFCVDTEKDRSKVNVLDVDIWEFYVVSTEQINRQLGPQKTAASSTIERLAEPVGCACFAWIKERVDSAL